MGKALLSDPQNNIRKGQELGTGITQKVYKGKTVQGYESSIGSSQAIKLDKGRIFFSTDYDEALDAFKYCCKLEGIIPALEPSHALAVLRKIAKMNHEQLLDYKNKKKWEIARWHYHNNSFYKSIVGSIFPSKWDDLPILEKKRLSA